LLQNQKKHTCLIEQIRTKVIEMEQHEWRVEFSWIRAHARHRGNEMADQLAKAAANNKNIEQCYNKIPNSAVWSELKELSVQQWKNEWKRSSKGAITKSFFPKIEDMLKLRIKATPNFTAIVTGHGNIKSYLYKYKIIDNPMCPCKKGDQTVDHILFECTLLEQERNKLKAVVTRTENWPLSYNKLKYKILQKLQRIHRQNNMEQRIEYK